MLILIQFISPIIFTIGLYQFSILIVEKKKYNFEPLVIFLILLLLFIQIITYLNIFQLYPSIFIQISFIFLFLFFLYFIKNLSFSNYNKYFSLDYILIFLIFFISLIPLNGADTYAYHLAWPRDLLLNKDIFFNKTFLEFRVVGIGEIINYISLNLYSENLQSFLAVFISYIIFYKSKILKEKKIITLLFLTSPMVLKYIFDQKPFILPILIFSYSIKFFFNIELEQKNKIYAVILFLLSISFFAGSKYTFLFQGFVTLLFILFYIIKNQIKILNIRIFYLSFVIFIFFFCTIPFMKFQYFGDPFTPFFETFKINPDEDILKLKEMYAHWTGTMREGDNFENLILNLLNFFIPTAPYTILDTLGLLSFSFLFIKTTKNNKILFWITFLSTYILVVYSNFQARWFLFPFIYLLISCEDIKYNKLLKFVTSIQAFVLLFFLFIYTVDIGKVIFNSSWEKLKEDRIYNYKLTKEINSITGGQKIITNTRNIFHLDNAVGIRYYNFSKKNISEKKKKKIFFGFFSISTGKNEKLNYDNFRNILENQPVLKEFDNKKCFSIIKIYNSAVAKRYIYSIQDYEAFVLIKLDNSLSKCYE